ncbi:zinc-binding dehydrogenase [Nonomuraea zeae]|uniref:Zinc-binding dehydrogenase n=1 Tax=Nonomuraea zeae TaxID=1642303 RepID=A0A5S4FMC6_9ACTN|nr:zinc-binding dehydrogenase [Nonomuraea zeae]TMR21813.1 zinc-binding dehydrogenase [Nonomuraea zeae]
MRAAVASVAGIGVTELPDPVPGPGQVLVRTLACGICGSDLHAARDLEAFAGNLSRVGAPVVFDPAGELVFGHEFSAELVGYGPDTAGRLPIGTMVCAVPMVLGPQGPESIGYSQRYPGGFGELMVLQEDGLLPVPEGRTAEEAALTEPLSVGEHAVAAARLAPSDVCVVVGCGPVGLAVIAALKARGHAPVVAADFSPARRSLAARLGADVVVDPAAESPYARWQEFGVPATALERGANELFGFPGNDGVIFECVGVPGVLQQVIDGAAAKSRVVVVGVCMEPDGIEAFPAIVKELEVRFVFGYTQAEFAAVLQRDVPAGLVTSAVGLDGVAGAFEALRAPGEHVKIMVKP